MDVLFTGRSKCLAESFKVSTTFAPSPDFSVQPLTSYVPNRVERAIYTPFESSWELCLE